MQQGRRTSLGSHFLADFVASRLSSMKKHHPDPNTSLSHIAHEDLKPVLEAVILTLANDLKIVYEPWLEAKQVPDATLSVRFPSNNHTIYIHLQF